MRAKAAALRSGATAGSGAARAAAAPTASPSTSATTFFRRRTDATASIRNAR